MSRRRTAARWLIDAAINPRVGARSSYRCEASRRRCSGSGPCSPEIKPWPLASSQRTTLYRRSNSDTPAPRRLLSLR
jgi:hypothetical protein